MSSRYQEYLKYLVSPEWRAKRSEAFAFYGRSCQRCRADDRELHVHHKTYKRLFNEALEDLEVLCWKCHAKEHKKPKKLKSVKAVRQKTPKKARVKKVSSTKKKNGWLEQYRLQQKKVRVRPNDIPASSWDSLQRKYEERRAERRARREAA